MKMLNSGLPVWLFLRQNLFFWHLLNTFGFFGNKKNRQIFTFSGFFSVEKA